MIEPLSRRSLLKTLGATTALHALPAVAQPAGSEDRATIPLHGELGETPAQQRARWIALAQSLRRDPIERPEPPIALVRPVADASQYLRWRMEQEAPATALGDRLLHRGDHFLLDFGGHRAGYFAFHLIGEGKSVDSPVRLKLTFGEVPGDVAEPLYPYKGQLSSAWLPEEIITVDFLPQRVRLPRRYAFRYVKVEVLDTSPNFGVRFRDVQAIAVSATHGEPAPLPAGTQEWIRQVDAIGARTLRDCMQTSFEDGPRRDQRLWLGDLRLQARASYVTYPNYYLVRRCLFLFAGLAREDGMVSACVFEKPYPMGSEPFLNDYSALFISALLELTRASKDLDTARELFPLAKRQMEILLGRLDQDGVYRVPQGEYIFIDWNRQLDYTAAAMGVLAYTLEHLLELADLIGRAVDVQPYKAKLAQIRATAHAHFYDKDRKFCFSGEKKEVSWATQAWMVLGGCVSREEAQACLRNGALTNATSVKPSTPYLYHYVAEALVVCGLRREALELIQQYWGGMAAAGADTFWELYDPADSTYSPYGDVHINSFCHAWSCTPTWFFRDQKLL
ncbi:hypothetical protein [Silvibacterium sp.]|uniref:alpha-L-rhamnosidase-related protein n=1 Tax=Silvibacterium sp. TaxID=1964179 RepID=UPI0039E6C2BC